MAESFVLNTGARIPSVGLGTWQIEHGAVSDAIYAAVKVFFLVAIVASFPLIFFPKFHQIAHWCLFFLCFKFFACMCMS
jgi:hypothetical protein